MNEHAIYEAVGQKRQRYVSDSTMSNCQFLMISR